MRILNRTAVAALATLLASCAANRPLPPGATYLPADSVFVLSLNLPTLTSSDLYKELKDSGGAVGLNRINLLKFAKAAGLDPFKDVTWLTFVGRRGETDVPIDQLSAVASGFDGRKVYDYLKGSGLPSDPHEGMDIFPIVIVQDRCRFCLGVLDDATAAFGDGETLKAMADVRHAASSGLASETTAASLLRTVDPKAAVWGMVRGKDLSSGLADLLARIQGGSKGPGALAPITDLSFFVMSGENVVVAVDALAGSNEDALLIADVIQGAGSLGKLALKQAKPEESGLLSSFRVQVDGKRVRVSASVPQAKLVELARTAAGGLFNAAFPALGLPSGLGPGR
jgi:hypothetical protein